MTVTVSQTVAVPNDVTLDGRPKGPTPS